MLEQARVVRLITLMEVVVIGGMLVNQDGMLRPNLNPRSLIGMIPNLNPRSLIGMIPNQLNIFLMSLYTFLKRVGKVVIITKKVITLKMEASQARVNLNIMKKASRARVNLNIMNLNLIGGVQDPSHYLIRMLAVVIGMVPTSLSLILNQFILAVVTGMVMMVTGCMT